MNCKANTLSREDSPLFHFYCVIIYRVFPLFLGCFPSGGGGGGGNHFWLSEGFQEIVHHGECHSWFALSNFITAGVVCSDKSVDSVR